jgi:hypothetical protein
MVLSAVFGGRQLPLTQLTPLVLTPYFTVDDLLALATTNAENYWVLALASLKARWYANIRYRQCRAEAEEQAREQQHQLRTQHEALVLANRLAGELADDMRRLTNSLAESAADAELRHEQARAELARPVDAAYIEALLRGDVGPGN